MNQTSKVRVRLILPVARVRAAGFTFIELLMVIALLGVFLALALPSFTGTVQRYRVSMAASQIANLLQFARIEAIRSRGYIAVAATGSPEPGCTPATLDAGVDWRCGIEAYSIVNDATGAHYDMLKTIPASSFNGVSVRLQAPQNVQAMVYGPMGISSSPSEGASGAAGTATVAIHVWPTALGDDPATVPPTLVHTVCTLPAGKVKVIASYLDKADLDQCTN